MGVSTTTNVKAGEEIFTYYGYPRKLPMPLDFPWYWELKKKIEDEETTDKKTQIAKARCKHLIPQKNLKTLYVKCIYSIKVLSLALR